MKIIKTIIFSLLIVLFSADLWAASPSKTLGQTALATTSVTHPDTKISSEITLSTKFETTVTMYHSSVEATANTNPGVFYVLVSPSSSGDNDWVVWPGCQFTTTQSTADTESMTATEPIGETVLAVASTTGFTARDMLYVQNTTITSSDWNMCKEVVTNTSIDLVHGLTYEQDSNSVIWNDVDKFICDIPAMAKGRAQVLFLHEGATGANAHIRVLYATGDSIQ
jgi:hypothetical protein